MKKAFVLIVLGTLLGIGAASAQISSNGTGGGDWSTGTTWSGGVVPTGTDNVVIQGSDAVTVSAAVSCANLTMNAGTKITISGAFALPGTSWNLDPTSTVEYTAVPSSFANAAYGNLIYDGAN